MTQRTRKLIGTATLMILVPIYALVAMTVAAGTLPGTSSAVQWTYYVVAGLIWVIPAGVVIRWMQRPEPGKAAAGRS